MGAIEVDWEVEGIISARESVEGMLKVIATKTKDDSGGFWCWDGRVSVETLVPDSSNRVLMTLPANSHTHGEAEPHAGRRITAWITQYFGMGLGRVV